MHLIGWLIGGALRFVLSLLVGGCMYVSDRVGLSAKLRLSSGWPTTEARIESRQMVRDSKGKEVVCRLGYSYTVNGEYYAGFFERLFSSDVPAAAFLRQLKDGQHFTVRYKERAPQKSVVDPMAMKLLLATPAIAPRTVRAKPHLQQPIMGPNPADTPISPFVGDDVSTMSSLSLDTQTLDSCDCQPSTDNSPQLPRTGND